MNNLFGYSGQLRTSHFGSSQQSTYLPAELDSREVPQGQALRDGVIHVTQISCWWFLLFSQDGEDWLCLDSAGLTVERQSSPEFSYLYKGPLLSRVWCQPSPRSCPLGCFAILTVYTMSHCGPRRREVCRVILSREAHWWICDLHGFCFPNESYSRGSVDSWEGLGTQPSSLSGTEVILERGGLVPPLSIPQATAK